MRLLYARTRRSMAKVNGDVKTREHHPGPAGSVHQAGSAARTRPGGELRRVGSALAPASRWPPAPPSNRSDFGVRCDGGRRASTGGDAGHGLGPTPTAWGLTPIRRARSGCGHKRYVFIRLPSVARGRTPRVYDTRQGRSGCALTWATVHLPAVFRFNNIRTVYWPTASFG